MTFGDVKNHFWASTYKINMADRYQNALLSLIKLWNTKNNIIHSLTTCTKTHTFSCGGWILSLLSNFTSCLSLFFFFFFFVPLYLAIQAVLKVKEAEFKMDLEKDLKSTVEIGAWLYAVTGLGPLGSLTEPLCLRSEYSPINEPSSSNSSPPSA